MTYGDGPAGAAAVAALGPGARSVSGAELLSADLKQLFEGLDTVVHLASSSTEPLAATRRVLDAVADAGVDRLVLVTSALVYGALPSKPVPLTDEAPLRPNPGFEPAVALGEVERLASDWKDAHPSAALVVLRPAPVVADESGWLAPMLAAARAVPVADDVPPAQFLHLDDLVDAVTVAVTSGIEGTCNVAPEGWLAGAEVGALDGRPSVRLPGRIAERIARWRWRAGMSPTPPGLLPWTVHPWVVASDRLRAAGWVPSHSNAEAFVAGHPPAPWATVSPKRRQEISLAVSVAGIAAAAGGAFAAARRLRSTRARRG